MNGVLRWLVVTLAVLHGLIHGLGAAKGLGWAAVPQLKEPIGTRAGIMWLVAGTVVVTAGLLLAAGVSGWWLAAGPAAVTSQAVILTSWGDAKVGTAANVVLLLAAVYGFASYGPGSLEAQWQARAEIALSQADFGPPPVVTASDLAALPAPVAGYLRRVGAVGQPRVRSFYADVHGRIRAGRGKAWMPFTGKQLNTYGRSPQRLFLMRANMKGLPVTVFHAYSDGSATMRGKLLSLVPVVNAAGPDMARAETVTVFNDLVVLAPAAIIDAPVRWAGIDDHRVRGTFTNGQIEVAATLVFNDAHELVDFISDDRLRASSDGSTLTRQRWSTPLAGYRMLHGRTVATTGWGRWHAPRPEGEFAYLEFKVDDIIYNPTSTHPTTSPEHLSARRPSH